MTRAVVFAYHDIGVRCLSVLLRQDIDVGLVLTHVDDPKEKIWFASVQNLAKEKGISVITPEDPNDPGIILEIRKLQPDFLFSFYYRHMLGRDLLNIPQIGALNMHGSLLPKYRGRVPVNWAIIKGEQETGATLHYMTVKPDAGDIVDQQTVPILADDTALDVFRKVTSAAELVLDRSLPKLISGRVRRIPQDASQASYFGKRTPEDGRIDWTQEANTVHNLVRGVAPPYPGAFTVVYGNTLKIYKSYLCPGERPKHPRGIYSLASRCFAVCGYGSVLRLGEVEWQGETLDEAGFARRLGEQVWEAQN